MAVAETIAVLFNGKLSQIDSLILDASISEVHTSEAQITEHPVEDGSNVTDHVNRKPDKLVINGLVTNTPIRFPEALPGLPVIQSLANLGSTSGDTSQTAYNQLRDLVDGKKLIKIITSLREYENVLLSNLTVNRDASSATALNFTVNATEVRLVQSDQIELSTPLPKEGNTRGEKEQSLGKKQAATSTPAQTQGGTTLFDAGKSAGII